MAENKRTVNQMTEEENEAFVAGMEMTLDYTINVSMEDMMLYEQIIAERQHGCKISEKAVSTTNSQMTLEETNTLRRVAGGSELPAEDWNHMDDVTLTYFIGEKMETLLESRPVENIKDIETAVNLYRKLGGDDKNKYLQIGAVVKDNQNGDYDGELILYLENGDINALETMPKWFVKSNDVQHALEYLNHEFCLDNNMMEKSEESQYKHRSR